MRRAGIAAVVTAVVAGTVWVAAASAQREDRAFRLTRQSHVVAEASGTPASAEWTPVPGLDGIMLCAPRGRVAVNVSLELEGDAVDVRVEDGDRVLLPEEVRFDPGGTRTAASFTFRGSASGDPVKTYDVEWRSATAQGETHLRSGSALLLWSKVPKAGCE